MAELNGTNFIARVRLSNKADETLAMPGDTCERVPASSLPLLLASRKIEPVTDANRPAGYGRQKPWLRMPPDAAEE